MGAAKLDHYSSAKIGHLSLPYCKAYDGTPKGIPEAAATVANAIESKHSAMVRTGVKMDLLLRCCKGGVPPYTSLHCSCPTTD